MHFALIGEKLGHSLSVPVHMAIFRLLGLRDTYELVEIPRPLFREKCTSLLRELDGLNVTIPYKKEIIPLLSDLDGPARDTMAVNTVFQGRGTNTDVTGFMTMLRSAGMDVENQPCFVLGTGGAARAAACALRKMRAASVTLVSRHPLPGQTGYPQLPVCLRGFLINATPSGMAPDTEGCPIPAPDLSLCLSRVQGVVDLIYNPPETVLLRSARLRGIPCCNGLTMLIAQAVAAQEIWQGRSLDPGIIPAVFRALNLP